MQNGQGEYNSKFALLNTASRVVTGQYVAHVTLTERAYQAADLHTGTSLLVQPTIGQSADLWRVSRTYVGCALKRPKDRALVESGAVPLALPSGPKALPAPVSPQARLSEIVSEVGVNNALVMLAAIERGATAV
jgi:hypothetical protein